MDAVLHRQKNAREVKLVAAEGTTGTKPTDQIKEEWCKESTQEASHDEYHEKCIGLCLDVHFTDIINCSL
ncbi:hypothetical protein GBAR_LOCUS21034, partial [Geodia barretti]